MPRLTLKDLLDAPHLCAWLNEVAPEGPSEVTDRLFARLTQVLRAAPIGEQADAPTLRALEVYGVYFYGPTKDNPRSAAGRERRARMRSESVEREANDCDKPLVDGHPEWVCLRMCKNREHYSLPGEARGDLALAVGLGRLVCLPGPAYDRLLAHVRDVAELEGTVEQGAAGRGANASPRSKAGAPRL